MWRYLFLEELWEYYEFSNGRLRHMKNCSRYTFSTIWQHSDISFFCRSARIWRIMCKTRLRNVCQSISARLLKALSSSALRKRNRNTEQERNNIDTHGLYIQLYHSDKTRSHLINYSHPFHLSVQLKSLESSSSCSYNSHKIHIECLHIVQSCSGCIRFNSERFQMTTLRNTDNQQILFTWNLSSSN